PGPAEKPEGREANRRALRGRRDSDQASNPAPRRFRPMPAGLLPIRSTRLGGPAATSLLSSHGASSQRPSGENRPDRRGGARLRNLRLSLTSRDTEPAAPDGYGRHAKGVPSKYGVRQGAALESLRGREATEARM